MPVRVEYFGGSEHFNCYIRLFKKTKFERTNAVKLVHSLKKSLWSNEYDTCYVWGIAVGICMRKQKEDFFNETHYIFFIKITVALIKYACLLYLITLLNERHIFELRQ